MALQAYVAVDRTSSYADEDGARVDGSSRRQPTSRSAARLALHSHGAPLRRKLVVGHDDDQAERDADHAAALALSDRCAVSRRASDTALSSAVPAPAIVESALATPGRPLDGETRSYFEPRLGTDLSAVRIHDDASADASARAVGAQAYTVAHHIAFASGRYAPATENGRRLIAHELAHVAQPSAPSAPVVRRRGPSLPEAPPGSCPPRAVGEVEASRRDRMDVREVTSPEGAEDVLVANFAIEHAAVKGHPTDTALWQGLVAEMEAQPDERWEIVGFSDCSGDEAVNDKLRRERAAAVRALLPPTVQGRVAAVRAAPPGDYMTGNETPLLRSWNRSALVRHAGGFKTVTLPAETIEARPKAAPETPKPSQDDDMWPKWKDRSLLSDAWDDILDAGKWGLRHAKNLAEDGVDDALAVGKWAIRRAKDLYHAGKWTARVAKGGFKAAWATFEGLASAVRHPIRTIEGIVSAIAHPGRTAKALAAHLLMTIGAIGRGDPEAIGNALFFAATFLVPGEAEAELAEETRLLPEATETERTTEEERLLTGSGPQPPSRPTITESSTASTRGATFQSASAQTERSLITAIRADIGEMQAYKEALLRGEIGLQRPLGANIPGPDFVTAAREGPNNEMWIVVTDAKTLTAEGGRFPTPATVMRADWRAEAVDAAQRVALSNATLEREIRDAAAAGRIRLRQLNVDFTPSGGGAVSGW